MQKYTALNFTNKPSRKAHERTKKTENKYTHALLQNHFLKSCSSVIPVANTAVQKIKSFSSIEITGHKVLPSSNFKQCTGSST